MTDGYNLLLIIGFFLSFYAITYICTKKKIISLIIHRKFWNVLLAMSFIASASLGLVLAFCIDYKLSLAWYANLLWFHVETGIIMTIIALFHLGWHLKYFFKLK